MSGHATTWVHEIRGYSVALAVILPSLAFAASLDPSTPPAPNEPTKAQ
jgi:hypothetical protein